jgi:2-isopropylmalate synthase
VRRGHAPSGRRKSSQHAFSSRDPAEPKAYAPGRRRQKLRLPVAERVAMLVRFRMSNAVKIYDTTLRDGTQGEGISFSVTDKLLIAEKLDHFGVDYIEGGFPGSNPRDITFFQEARKLRLKHARLAAFGSTRRAGAKAADDLQLKTLLDSGMPVTTIVGKTWTLHVTEILRTTLEENLAMIEDSTRYLVAQGREVIYDAEHFFDGYKVDSSYALETLRAAIRGGAETVVLCDTNGGTMPWEVECIVRELKPALDYPFGIHTHNDSECAVSNSLIAVREGAVQVQGTMNGIGERCGNVDLVSVIANLSLKYGYEALPKGSLLKLTEASRYVYEVANMNFRGNQPFVGVSAFAHKGGMHTHAVGKNPISYEHIDPAKVGNERRILVSELSGQSTILNKTAKYSIQHDRAMMQEILMQVQNLENVGYEFEAAEASFDLLGKKAMGQYRPWFEKLHYRVNI